jgi:hypothetical protein
MQDAMKNPDDPLSEQIIDAVRSYRRVTISQYDPWGWANEDSTRGYRTIEENPQYAVDMGYSLNGEIGIRITRHFGSTAHDFNAYIDPIDWQDMQLYGVTIDDIAEWMYMYSEMDLSRCFEFHYLGDTTNIRISLSTITLSPDLLLSTEDTGGYPFYYFSREEEKWDGTTYTQWYEFAPFTSSSGYSAYYFDKYRFRGTTALDNAIDAIGYNPFGGFIK